MIDLLEKYIHKPVLYEESSDKFWDDEHISKGMLAAHLNPGLDAATRKMEFIQKSVDWIAEKAPPQQYFRLLDLGCGPGIYAELFNKQGYSVTGIDYSARSIGYANAHAMLNHSKINYYYQNYLTIDYCEEFDVITLIYCDFEVLSAQNRRTLLEKVYKALKPGGMFIFDAFTSRQYEGKNENTSWEYSRTGGFWSAESYLCLNSFYRYDEEDTVLDQFIVITDKAIHCYNNWKHYFSEESLLLELKSAGFINNELFGDIAGDKYRKDGKTICAIALK